MGKLTDKEREQLHAALLDAFGHMHHFELLVKRLGKNPDEYAPKEGISVRLNALIQDIENQDNVEALFDTPSTVRGWESSLGLKAAIDSVRKSYMERKVSNCFDIADPFEVCFLEQGRPFINRDDFRTFMHELNKEQGKRFLVVNGPRGSGRTHSHYLIEALAPHCNYKFCFIELENEISTKYYPDIMARRIDRDLTLQKTDQMPEQENVGERWAQELCDWLVEKMLLENSRSWIVLDGFGDLDLPDETKRLVSCLIDAVDKRLPQVRLVLLDYSVPLPVKLRPFVNVEDLQEIGQTELKAFFETVFKQARVDHDDQQMQDITTKILEGLPGNLEDRMLEIMMRVMDIKNQLLQKE